ncbi:hypothetical protein G5V57_17530 [Nordella sp. HKS 07]|uniref:hypothetical protein n=1 Tax=Nordella sp. HKS 07 TaxID=2712222 RepID=UPI0013E14404|nr:hypothetical protein [Nordella sp. HKS 07]QIG49366.1 hypothetical protein G5V57_17530 [Nordella sp. HKS 07]
MVTIGDDPDKAADLIAHIVSDEAATICGQFLWIENGLRRPLPSWWNGIEVQPGDSPGPDCLSTSKVAPLSKMNGGALRIGR